MPVAIEEVERAQRLLSHCPESDELVVIKRLGALEVMDAFLALHSHTHPHKVKDIVISIARSLIKAGSTPHQPRDQQMSALQRKAIAMLIWKIPYRIIPRDFNYAELNAEMLAHFVEQADVVLELLGNRDQSSLNQYIDDVVLPVSFDAYRQQALRTQVRVRLHHFETLIDHKFTPPGSVPLLVSEAQSCLPDHAQAKQLVLMWRGWQFWACQAARDRAADASIRNDLVAISHVVSAVKQHVLHEMHFADNKIRPWKDWRIQCIVTLQLIVNDFLQATKLAPPYSSTPEQAA